LIQSARHIFFSMEYIYHMSETFEHILVKDDRLGCITQKVKYQVLKGGQHITCQTYKAISTSGV
ncbi:MAG: phage major capsid domain-containing protein, partial [Candidatus Fonsibacter sp.]